MDMAQLVVEFARLRGISSPEAAEELITLLSGVLFSNSNGEKCLSNTYKRILEYTPRGEDFLPDLYDVARISMSMGSHLLQGDLFLDFNDRANKQNMELGELLAQIAQEYLQTIKAVE